MSGENPDYSTLMLQRGIFELLIFSHCGNSQSSIAKWSMSWWAMVCNAAAPRARPHSIFAVAVMHVSSYKYIKCTACLLTNVPPLRP